MENHSIVGGVGLAVAEDDGRTRCRKAIDTSWHSWICTRFLSRDYLLKEYGIDASALVKAMEQGAAGQSKMYRQQRRSEKF